MNTYYGDQMIPAQKGMSRLSAREEGSFFNIRLHQQSSQQRWNRNQYFLQTKSIIPSQNNIDCENSAEDLYQTEASLSK